MLARPRVFTIPPTAPFLPALARAVLDGALIPGFAPRENPALLGDATIYLPTRRAARALAQAFLDALGTDAAILPRIVPLGDVDEDAFAFERDDTEPLPPAIEPARRRLALARLIARLAEIQPGLLPGSPAAAIALADELAHLMDDFITAGIGFSALKDAVLPELDQYWSESRKFLELVDNAWAAHLAERRRIDPARRRDQLLACEATRLAGASSGPVIAAGSTGTLPKVADLLRVIAGKENGAVVLPGLDLALEDEVFAKIGGKDEPMFGHPQFGLKRLIEKLGVVRSEIRPIAETRLPAREAILSQAFRPALDGAATSGTPADSLDGVTIVEAADAREEALGIALALRETLNEPLKRAALVTPDRALARRVCAELTRWNIAVDDSAGLPLGDTEAGRFARLVVEAAAADAAPVTLLALLRHAYARPLFTSAEIDLFEIAALRGPRPAGGAAGLSRAIDGLRREKFHRRDARSSLDAAQWDIAAAVAQRIQEILAPLAAFGADESDFGALIAAHREALLRAAPAAWETDKDDINALGEAIDDLAAAAADAPAMRLADYADTFPALVRGQTVRPSRPGSARIRILGPLEARMISVERMVLGGLCEGIWPPDTHSDSWLNRPMRSALGLDLPERRIGLSAHDFVQAAGAPELFLMRARKQNGIETIASRFVQRLAAIAPEQAWEQARSRGEHYLALVRAFEHAAPEKPIEPPRPAPPLSVRPTRFSVSDIRDLVRDPYTIYAKHILNLNAFDLVDEEPGAAARGTMLHDVLAQFAQKFPDSWPENALDELLAIGRAAFEPLQNFPAARAIWWPRFERVARWFVEEERARRTEIRRVISEQNGAIDIPLRGGSIRLSARADRIDVTNDGSITILDYKTGELPTLKQALLGFEPQLPLEAAIARGGGFRELPKDAQVKSLGPVKISGGDPAGEFKLFEIDGKGEAGKLAERLGVGNADDLADLSLRRVTQLLAHYADAQLTPYLSIPRPKWRKRYSDYDHLARIKEWSAAEGEEE